jgi:hypothetical protein
MRKNIIILIFILLSVLLSGCQLTKAVNHNLFNKRQVKITKFAVPYLDNFIPIFFKENTIIAQQGIDVPRHEMSLYSSSNFKEYKKIAFFENHFGQFYVNPYNSKEVFLCPMKAKKVFSKALIKDIPGRKYIIALQIT